ncbi:MAG: radical SAM protein [SAR324 cluster bacterium]|uniref:Radical SAM protein n=1 Tax=SAR324 cluster bacterium TaxID=2024889 RepID=A0A7X9IJ94_9DELT|nr:radical SAM protein [SAR324 cluster bacterium]
MIPLYEVSTIHVEVTNACNLECANCTRFVGHHRKPFMMDLVTVRKALESLEGFPGKVGLMGGEPTAHPKYKEICELFQELVPDKERRQLWTNGYKWKQYESVTLETFFPHNCHYNDHQHDEDSHQPLLIAAEDVLEDKELMWKLIDKCWIQTRWSASITPKGCFFCEVAAAQDHLFDGPGGYAIEKGWWKKTPQEFKDQVCRYCRNCSAAIPMDALNHHEDYDLVSPSVAKKLESVASPRYRNGKIKIFDHVFTKAEIEERAKTWTPWCHRPFKQNTPELFDTSPVHVHNQQIPSSSILTIGAQPKD